MQSKKADVKSKSQIVGVAEYPEYDSTVESVEQEGEEKILSYINAMTKTNAMNTVRASVTGTPGKARLRKEAFARITIEEFTECAGDQVRIDQLLDKKVAELEAEYKAAVPEATDDDDDEDE